MIQGTDPPKRTARPWAARAMVAVAILFAVILPVDVRLSWETASPSIPYASPALLLGASLLLLVANRMLRRQEAAARAGGPHR